MFGESLSVYWKFYRRFELPAEVPNLTPMALKTWTKLSLKVQMLSMMILSICEMGGWPSSVSIY